MNRVMTLRGRARPHAHYPRQCTSMPTATLPERHSSLDAAQAPHTSASAPSARDLTTLECDQLLVLLEVHHAAGENAAGERCEVFCIAMVLAHRLGISCESYVRLMVGALTVTEWRGFFAEDGSPAFVLR